jgi:hypothetical protein
VTYLNEKQVEEIAKVSAAVAVQKALEFMDQEKEKREKERHDRRLRNTKLLLKNYRSIAEHVRDIREDISELDEQLEIDDLDTDTFQIVSIKRSKSRSLAMVKYINYTIGLYKVHAAESINQEEQRRYDTVYKMYISDPKFSADKISELHSITPRMVYKDVNKACETLAVLMFGVDGIRFLH